MKKNMTELEYALEVGAEVKVDMVADGSVCASWNNGTHTEYITVAEATALGLIKEEKAEQVNPKLERLQASLEKSEAKVAKIEATIARHYKQLDKKIAVFAGEGFDLDYSGVKFGMYSHKFMAQPEVQKFYKIKEQWMGGVDTDKNWAMYEVINKLEDINNSYKKLAEAQQVVSNWEDKIAKEVAFEAKAEQAPQVIMDFLDKWEELVVEWMMQHEKHPDEKRIRAFVAHEKYIKLVQLTMRVEQYTGTITDARGLQISEKGDLIGIIIGEKGKAHLQSVMAGGWNIQCFHFRTLVHPA